MCYNPVSIFAQVPPRHNAYKRAGEEQEISDSIKNTMSEKNGNVHNEIKSENNESKEKINAIIKTVGVYCGYDYTIAIQPGI